MNLQKLLLAALDSGKCSDGVFFYSGCMLNPYSFYLFLCIFWLLKCAENIVMELKNVIQCSIETGTCMWVNDSFADIVFVILSHLNNWFLEDLQKLLFVALDSGKCFNGVFFCCILNPCSNSLFLCIFLLLKCAKM